MKHNLISYKEEFIYYLNRLDCFKEFKYNLKKEHDISIDEYLINNFYKQTDIEELICFAFSWFKSKEGFNYWSNIDKQFAILIRDHSYKLRNINSSIWDD